MIYQTRKNVDFLKKKAANTKVRKKCFFFVSFYELIFSHNQMIMYEVIVISIKTERKKQF